MYHGFPGYRWDQGSTLWGPLAYRPYAQCDTYSKSKSFRPHNFATRALRAICWGGGILRTVPTRADSAPEDSSTCFRTSVARKNGPAPSVRITACRPVPTLRFIHSFQSLIRVDRRTAISGSFQYRISAFLDVTPYLSAEENQGFGETPWLCFHSHNITKFISRFAETTVPMKLHDVKLRIHKSHYRKVKTHIFVGWDVMDTRWR